MITVCRSRQQKQSEHGWLELYCAVVQSLVLIASLLVTLECVCVCKDAFNHMGLHLCARTHKQTHIHTMPGHTETASAQWSIVTAALKWGQHRRMALCFNMSLQPKVHTEKLVMTSTQHTASTVLNVLDTKTFLQWETCTGHVYLRLKVRI